MPELAVIVPTYNERSNVVPMVTALDQALAGIDYEVIFVDDDSPDGTADEVRAIASRTPRVRLLHRINRRGLASAAVEGMMSSSADYLAVMDGDLQHDERILPQMLARIKAEHLDLVVGTRYSGGSMGDFAPNRVALSNLGRRLSMWVCHAALSDPMSGYFVVSRPWLMGVVRSLSTVGFKILLDLVASSDRPVRFAEIAYTFRKRVHGESKLNLLVGLEYLELLLDKRIGDWIPVRYAMFGIVGTIGVAAQLALVGLFLETGIFQFRDAQLYSSLLVILLNFVLNDRFTFRSRRLRGWRWPLGLVVFAIGCSIGVFSNLRVAGTLRQLGVGWLPASAAGILIGSVWNYAVSSVFVWRVNRRGSRRRGQPAPVS